jgi:cell division protein FtsB
MEQQEDENEKLKRKVNALELENVELKKKYIDLQHERNNFEVESLLTRDS